MPRCEHKRWASDNVVTSCFDCDEHWTAVPVDDWPKGCASMYARLGMSDACGCGAAWTQVRELVYCTQCDMSLPTDEEKAVGILEDTPDMFTVVDAEGVPRFMWSSRRLAERLDGLHQRALANHLIVVALVVVELLRWWTD